MIYFMIYDVSLSEDVEKDAARSFLAMQSDKNNTYEILINVVVNFGMAGVIVLLIHIKIIKPINQLSRTMSTK